ncbi:hypothetical protein B0H16DRAFT_1894048, partial [Mycena metata]
MWPLSEIIDNAREAIFIQVGPRVLVFLGCLSAWPFGTTRTLLTSSALCYISLAAFIRTEPALRGATASSALAMALALPALASGCAPVFVSRPAVGFSTSYDAARAVTSFTLRACISFGYGSGVSMRAVW